MIETGSNNTIAAIFDRAIEIEYKAANIYKKFSKLFSHMQSLASFWQELAEDEIQHATTLQDVRNSLNDEQLLTPCDKKISDKVDMTRQMLRGVAIESIKNLDDAYELAHELEFSEVNTVFNLLASAFVPFEERKQFIVAEIHKHQQKLLNFKHNFGDRNWRKKIRIRHA